MTIEDAIKNIVAYIYFAEDIPEEVGKAFDMAIMALKFTAVFPETFIDFINIKKKELENEDS